MDLVGEEAQYSDRDNLSGPPAETWVAQRRLLHRSNLLVGRTVASVDPFENIGRERAVARRLAVGDRRVEQPMPFVTGEQGSPHHGVSPPRLRWLTIHRSADAEQADRPVAR